MPNSLSTLFPQISRNNVLTCGPRLQRQFTTFKLQHPARRAARRPFTSGYSPRRHIPNQENTSTESADQHYRSLSVEDRVRAIRLRFKERVPEGVLATEEERRVFERFYGPPLTQQHEEGLSNVEVYGEREAVLMVDDGQGGLKPVQAEEGDEIGDTLSALGDVGNAEYVIHDADQQLEKDIKAALDTEEQPERNEAAMEDAEDGESRTHPLTAAGRFTTFPSTLQLPKESLIAPITDVLSEASNRHLDEVSERIFGGAGLPYSNAAPRLSRSMPQRPVPLSAAQTKMTEMEANTFMAALIPSNYAVAMSILTEIRKRLGPSWIGSLLNSKGGPRILDAGSGGAAVIAWRELLKAEWAQSTPAPVGKATVLTGSDALRHKSSRVLDNTTFLPRLPDYVHSSFGEDSPRKQYDIVVAPHSLWHIPEQHLREQQLQNLWSLVDPTGGILVLWEKGVPRGFEAIADARQTLLRDYFTSDASTTRSDRPHGRIVAPCTTHGKCPMYTIPGISRRRKDYCHFEQRFIRPGFYQRLCGGRDRNYEDAPFSYIAVRKGEPTPLSQTASAASAAFSGHSLPENDFHPPKSLDALPSSPLYTTLPRLILPPLKRKGHVILDVCTPVATLERWTVPRSFGGTAYRDARKAAWGDLWALGAKTRVPRSARVGLSTDPETEGDEEVPRTVDVKGKVRSSVPDNMNGEREEQRQMRPKDRGRAKARNRRREETRELIRRAERDDR